MRMANDGTSSGAMYLGEAWQIQNSISMFPKAAVTILLMVALTTVGPVSLYIGTS